MPPWRWSWPVRLLWPLDDGHRPLRFFLRDAGRMRRANPFGLPYEGLVFLVSWSRVH